MARLSREEAVRVLRTHAEYNLALEPLVANTIERGQSVALHSPYCDVIRDARAFLAGQPIPVDAVLAMAALTVSFHHVQSKQEVKHVA